VPWHRRPVADSQPVGRSLSTLPACIDIAGLARLALTEPPLTALAESMKMRFETQDVEQSVGGRMVGGCRVWEEKRTRACCSQWK